MSEPAAHDLAQPPGTTEPVTARTGRDAAAGSPAAGAATPVTSRPGRAAWWFRAVVAIVAIGAVAWYLRSQRPDRASSPGRAGLGSGSQSPETAVAGPPGRGGGGGGRRGGGDFEGRVVPVQVATVARMDLPIWLEGLGTVAAVQQVTVRPQVDGRIDKVLFVEGQPVKRGDVLVQIDPRPFLVALHQAQGALARDKAQLETLQSNLKRYEGLKAQNLVAGQQVEEIAGQVGQFEGSVKIDQAQIENAQLQLDYAQVKAPIDGITGVRLIDAGNIIRQSDPSGIVVITAIDPAAVFFTLPQDQLTSVAQALARGDVPVEAYSRDGATKLATGKLAVLDNQINAATATLRLKAVMPNADRTLWPNAFVKARMLIETRKDAIVIPTVAIQRGPQGTFVYAVGPDRTAEMKPVTIALTTGEVAVIGKGLAGGEQVIIEGQNQVRPGGKVAPAGAGGGETARPGRPGGGPNKPGGRPGSGLGDGPGSSPGAGPAGGPGGGSGGGPGGAAGGGRHRRGPPGTEGTAAEPPGAIAPGAGRPESGQPRSRDPAAGPAASSQPAAP